jgi:hypothetical protein
MFTPSFSAIFKYKYTSDNHKNYGKLMKAQNTFYLLQQEVCWREEGLDQSTKAPNNSWV